MILKTSRWILTALFCVGAVDVSWADLAFSKTSSRVSSELIAVEETAENATPATNQRRGISRTEEKAWIVGITIVVATVIAWILAGRTQEDIARLLNKGKSPEDLAAEEAKQAEAKTNEESESGPAEEPTAEASDDVTNDTTPEIPADPGNETELEIPANSDSPETDGQETDELKTRDPEAS